MYICICNAISDKTVKAYLDNNKPGRAKALDVYEACSNGEKPECCQCLATLKSFIQTHNQVENLA